MNGKPKPDTVEVMIPVMHANCVHPQMQRIRMPRRVAEAQGLVAPRERLEGAAALTATLNALIARARRGDVRAQQQLRRELEQFPELYKRRRNADGSVTVVVGDPG